MHDETVKNSIREAIAIACEPADVGFHVGDPIERYGIIECPVHVCAMDLTLYADSEADDPEDLRWRFCWRHGSYDLAYLPSVLLAAMCDELAQVQDHLRDMNDGVAWAMIRSGRLP